MGRVKILPEEVANQIAAGEVIERPAGVVKELVENSLDAEASRIEVEYHCGGKEYIRVEDNGSGIATEDIRPALQRHGTSKIRLPQDLLHISSFGFRGEALPSIASISCLTLQTCPRGSQEALEIRVEGGKVVYERSCGLAEGTVIEVEQLFKTVPVRRKFLKTDNTEAAHIIHLMQMLAVAHPEIAFALQDRGRKVFKSPTCQRLQDRIAEIFGERFAEPLIPIEAEAKEEGLKLKGLIGKPGTGRSTTQDIATFVNQRPVDNRTLNYAIIEAYHTYIPKGRYPMAFLFLEICPEEVDVNVHPTKREVRFQREGTVRRFVIESVLARLRKASTNTLKPPLKAPPIFEPQRQEIKAPQGLNRKDLTATKVTQAERTAQTLAYPKRTKNFIPLAAQAPASPAEPSLPPRSSIPSLRPIEASQKLKEGGGIDETSKQTSKLASEKKALNEEAAGPSTSIPWRWIGTLNKGYGLFSSEDGLIILQAAHSQARILFECIQEKLKQEKHVSQQLLFPVTVEITALLAVSLKEHESFFQTIGFRIEPFGRQMVRISSVPDWLTPSLAEGFLQDMLAHIRERGLQPERTIQAREEVARLAAKRVASRVKLNDAAAWNRLAAELMSCEHPLIDAEGRKTFVEISYRDLAKQLGA